MSLGTKGKSKKKQNRRRQYGVPKFGKDGKLKKWIKKRLGD